MFKLLIFDLDGTLVDTARDITDALNYALRPFTSREYSIEETKAMVGSGISKLLESLVPPQPDPSYNVKAGQEAIERFLYHYDNHLIRHTALYPGVRETLEKLGGYKKAVLSNKREKYSIEIVERLGIAEFFDLVWGSDSVREKKPSPVPVLDMIRHFQLATEDTILTGDSNYDVDAGKSAGVKVIGVTYGFRTREFLQGADLLIDRFDDLLPAIDSLDSRSF